MENHFLISNCPFIGSISFYFQLFNIKKILFNTDLLNRESVEFNRTHLLSSQGIISLSIPLQGGRNTKSKLDSILISDTVNWKLHHLKTIETNYRKAPYFSHYFYDLQDIYNNHQNLFLAQFNEQLFKWVINKLHFEIEILETKDINSEFQGISQKLENKNINIQYQPLFSTNKSIQIEKLSILDMMFNCGSREINYLFLKT